MTHDLTPLYATYRWTECSPEELPAVGDYVTMDEISTADTNNWRYSVTDPLAGYEVPVTLWGDYCGDDIGRTNYRSLLRDFPESFVEVSGDYSSQYLMVLPAALEGEDGEHLVEILVGLRDTYALYDEGDWSELAMEIELEDWVAGRESDVRTEVTEKVGRLLMDHDWAETLVEACTSEALHQAFADVAYANEGPNMETATQTYVPYRYFGEATDAVARKLISTGRL